jgi:hypothetical protein
MPSAYLATTSGIHGISTMKGDPAKETHAMEARRSKVQIETPNLINCIEGLSVPWASDVNTLPIAHLLSGSLS